MRAERAAGAATPALQERPRAMPGAPSRRRWALALVYGFLLTYLGFVLFPLVWLLLSSFKTRADALALPPQIIFIPTFEAYEKLFTAGILMPFGNSMFVAFTNIATALVLGVPAAYALARMQGGAKQHLSFWVLSTRMAPAFGVIVPIYALMRTLGLLDTRFSVTLAHLSFNLPFAIWLLMRYFEDLPVELEEAALVDGASRWGALRHAVLPVSAPMLVAVAILVFVASWNEFILAFILTSAEARTVPVLVASLAGTMAFDWPLMSAVSAGAMVPALLLVFVVQRHITRGLTLGAIQ